MRRARWILVAVLCVLLPMMVGADTNEGPHKLRVSLHNGSRLVGITTLTGVNIDLGFKTLEVPLQRIQRIDRVGGAHGSHHRLFFTNGDILTGKLLEKSIDLDAAFDELSMPMQMVSRIEVLSQQRDLLIQEGLVLHLPFDTDTGSEILNQSPVDHEIHATGIKFDTDNQRGRAAIFGGRCQIQVAHSQTLCPKNLTLGGWMYPTRLANGYQVVAAKSQPSSWHGGYGLYCYGENVCFFVNGYNSTSVQTKLPLNRWSHIMAVCTDTGVQLYLDGNLVQQGPINQTAHTPAGANKSFGGITNHVDSPLVLGSDSNYESWNGMLDDFVLFNRALSPTEIRSLVESSR